ncbi:MAG: CDP-diacylglycerol--serine O-phosphatidyltransferase [Calditrichaeota bacterium]|nr:MAG: CDP-diacylglycerol--serine O-phosphatidyltransferase [Calditrichota bacterium]
MKKRRRLKLLNTKKLVPNAFTIGNLLCGFLSVIFASRGIFESACWLILLAILFDALDGKFARMLGTESEFGIEFDSLADVTSFGLAPSMLVYFCFFEEITFANNSWLTFFGLAICSLPVTFGAVRLARYNVMANQSESHGIKQYFTGLPIPASATVIVTFILFFIEVKPMIEQNISNEAILIIVSGTIILVSSLMISHIPYYKVSSVSAKTVKSKFFSASIVIGIVAIWFLFSFQKGAFPIALLYIFWAIVSYFGKKLLSAFTDTDDEEEITTTTN